MAKVLICNLYDIGGSQHAKYGLMLLLEWLAFT